MNTVPRTIYRRPGRNVWSSPPAIWNSRHGRAAFAAARRDQGRIRSAHRNDVNSVRPVALQHRRQELTAGELAYRGYYLGRTYLQRQKSSRWAICIMPFACDVAPCASASRRSLRVHDIVANSTRSRSRRSSRSAASSDEFKTLNGALSRLDASGPTRSSIACERARQSASALLSARQARST